MLEMFTKGENKGFHWLGIIISIFLILTIPPFVSSLLDLQEKQEYKKITARDFFDPHSLIISDAFIGEDPKAILDRSIIQDGELSWIVVVREQTETGLRVICTRRGITYYSSLSGPLDDISVNWLMDVPDGNPPCKKFGSYPGKFIVEVSWTRFLDNGDRRSVGITSNVFQLKERDETD